MRRLRGASIVIWAMLTLETLASASPMAELRCDQPPCVPGASTGQYFTVEGHAVYVGVSGKVSLEVDCGGWAALDSSAMPRFTSALTVSTLRLRACPSPATHSLSAALAALNVTLYQADDKATLFLEHLPASPQLTAAHFAGLTHLTHLKITSTALPASNSDLSFLTTLSHLSSLEIYRLPSPVPDLNSNKTLVDLKQSTTTIKPLTETPPAEVVMEVKIKSSKENLMKEKIKRVNLTPDQENVWVEVWEERKVAPLRLCDNLKVFHFLNAKVVELPDRWVAECPRLEFLTVWRAKNLTTLPANFLEGATALQSLDLSTGVLESLPDGFLLGAPNLTRLMLYENRLTMLTSATLMGPPLEELSLHNNQLNNEALQAIGSLTTLTSLDISNNPLSNLCERNGDSMLKNLTKLQYLGVESLNITHLCRDWSEMKFLRTLRFSKTQITELDFSDVYLSKDSSVKSVMYMFDGIKLDKLRFTQDEYELAVRNPPKTRLSFMSDDQFRSGCDMFDTISRRYRHLGWIPRMSCLTLEIVD